MDEINLVSLCKSNTRESVADLRKIAKDLKIDNVKKLTKVDLCRLLSNKLNQIVSEIIEVEVEQTDEISQYFDPVSYEVLYNPVPTSDGQIYNLSTYMQLTKNNTEVGFPHHAWTY